MTQHLKETAGSPASRTGLSREMGLLGLVATGICSMIGAAICDGDWVVVRAQADASSGDVVAAMIQDVDGASATIKVLSRKDGHQWLLPRNPDYAPIAVLPGDPFSIEGRAVGLIRHQLT